MLKNKLRQDKGAWLKKMHNNNAKKQDQRIGLCNIKNNKTQEQD